MPNRKKKPDLGEKNVNKKKSRVFHSSKHALNRTLTLQSCEINISLTNIYRLFCNFLSRESYFGGSLEEVNTDVLVECNKNNKNRLFCVGFCSPYRVDREPVSLRLPFRVLPAKAAVGSRPPTQDKQKTEKSGRLLSTVNNKEENALLFSVFCLRRLKRAGTDRSRRD